MTLLIAGGLGYLLMVGSRFAKLIGYFLYMSIACTLIPLPTPPYVIAMTEHFHPVLVALVGALGNCLAAFVEYYTISWVLTRSEIRQRLQRNTYYRRFSRFFNRAAFACVIFTGFTPIPFEPFRLAAIFTRYEIKKYLAAVFIGRLARYYLIAILGYVFDIPMIYLIIGTFLLIFIPLAAGYYQSRGM